MAGNRLADSAVAPYLSIVATSRNDGYGGNVIGKMQVFIDCVFALAEECELSTEVVIVDWNPPAEKQKLREEIVCCKSEYASIRFIEVPNTIHREMPHAENVYLYEYIAKNVGVRRARGEFILVTNPDNFFSRPLFQELSKKQLLKNSFYRIGRLNLKRDIPTSSASYDERYAFARKNQNIESFRTRFAGYSNSFLKKYIPLRLLLGFVRNYIIPSITHYPFQAPVLCTPGDFLLLHSKKWFELRGFEEVSPESGKAYSGSDLLLVYKALSLGLKQKYFYSLWKDLRIYSMPQDGEKFTIHGPSYLEEYHRLCRKMVQERKPVIRNDANWGLGGKTLEETHC